MALTRLKITNLPPQLTSEQLASVCRSISGITEVFVSVDGTGGVTASSLDAANAVVQKLRDSKKLGMYPVLSQPRSFIFIGCEVVGCML